MAESEPNFTEQQLDAITKTSSLLFGQAIAQGMHSPFMLNKDYWGRTYAEELIAALIREEDDDDGD